MRGCMFPTVKRRTAMATGNTIPCITAFLLLSGSVLAQQSVLEVLNADRLVASATGDHSIRELIGNVWMRQENVNIRCDRAIQNITLNTAELIGNVVITQDTLVMKTDRGLYRGDDKLASTVAGIYLFDGHTTLTAQEGRYETTARRAFFTSRVFVDEPSAAISCDHLRYDRDSSQTWANGNVVVRFKNENSMVTGDTVSHNLKSKISVFTGKPVLWQLDSVLVKRDSLTASDSVRIDTVSIVADSMRAVRDSTNMFFAIGNVAIVRGGLAARCEHLSYFRSDSTIILRHKPIIWYEETQMTADSMVVRLANDELERLMAFGDAFSLAKSKPSEDDTLSPPGRYDQIKGREIEILFADEKPSQVNVVESAFNLYYLYDENALNGVRIESGDRIHIFFRDGEASEVRTIGGVEGSYFPEKMVNGRESSFNLEGFELRMNRPEQPRPKTDIHVTSR